MCVCLCVCGCPPHCMQTQASLSSQDGVQLTSCCQCLSLTAMREMAGEQGGRQSPVLILGFSSSKKKRLSASCLRQYDALIFFVCVFLHLGVCVCVA